jgi:hypothetical protein
MTPVGEITWQQGQATAEAGSNTFEANGSLAQSGLTGDRSTILALHADPKQKAVTSRSCSLVTALFSR